MAYLPVPVVAELELNSVIPPPDTIEEERKDELIVNAINSKPNPHYSTQRVVRNRRVTNLLSSSIQKWSTELKTR